MLYCGDGVTKQPASAANDLENGVDTAHDIDQPSHRQFIESITIPPADVPVISPSAPRLCAR